jgi:hypothetical protein
MYREWNEERTIGWYLLQLLKLILKSGLACAVPDASVKPPDGTPCVEPERDEHCACNWEYSLRTL